MLYEFFLQSRLAEFSFVVQERQALLSKLLNGHRPLVGTSSIMRDVAGFGVWLEAKGQQAVVAVTLLREKQSLGHEASRNRNLHRIASEGMQGLTPHFFEEA